MFYYEDQGDMRRIHAATASSSRPAIRHKVLHSEGVQVVEIGVPAEHVTEIDHEMTLPTPHLRPEREWDGQRFVHRHRQATAVFTPFRIPGFEARDTTINANTKGVASVMVARPTGQPAPWTKHDGDILFSFVMTGGDDAGRRGQRALPPVARRCLCDPAGDGDALQPTRRRIWNCWK